MTLALYLNGLEAVCRLTLSCDSGDCSNEQTFTGESYVAQRAASTKAGWVERQGSAGREFWCPQCSKPT
jgi:hypothetical protein